MVRLSEAKQTYAGEWIAFRTFKEGDDPEGKVLLHDQNRREFDRLLLESGLADVYITFAGPAVPERYAAIFQASS